MGCISIPLLPNDGNEVSHDGQLGGQNSERATPNSYNHPMDPRAVRVFGSITVIPVRLAICSLGGKDIPARVDGEEV
jgi:hypothetical protein